MLTDKRLLLVDGKSLATRLVIPVRSIASISASGRRRNSITLSWGASSPRTIILEFRSLVKGGAEESVGQWLRAFELTSKITTSLTRMPIVS